MASPVDPRIPLSLLEAVRTIDTPEGVEEAEYVPELRNKRLGLSDTVYAQIRRYVDAVRRGQRIPHEEAAGLARLIGRRPDAEAVFRAAGLGFALSAYETLPAHSRGMMRMLPGMLARPIALGHLRRLGARLLNGEVSRVGASLVLEVRETVTYESAPRHAGCTYYESSLRELLTLLVNGAGAVQHVRCAERGEGTCQWRAEWRPLRGG
jgi:predicted hydrocarbon binding protein